MKRLSSDDRKMFRQFEYTNRRMTHQSFVDHFRNRRLQRAWESVPSLLRAHT